MSDDDIHEMMDRARFAEIREQRLRIEVDRLKAENERLTFALQGLHDDMADYSRLNHLGAENNHWMVIARAALAAKS